MGDTTFTLNDRKGSEIVQLYRTCELLDDDTRSEYSELMVDRDTRTSFLDFTKSRTTTRLTMHDYLMYGPLPIRTDLNCWWCRHPFKTSPLGVPIRYEAKKEEDYFETDGVFCSFPCCLAYIYDNPKTPLYREADVHLHHLYYKIYGKYRKIEPAPTWKILKDYGGHLSIREFRENFTDMIYTITLNVKRPYMFTTGTYIEEKTKI